VGVPLSYQFPVQLGNRVETLLPSFDEVGQMWINAGLGNLATDGGSPDILMKQRNAACLLVKRGSVSVLEKRLQQKQRSSQKLPKILS